MNIRHRDHHRLPDRAPGLPRLVRDVAAKLAGLIDADDLNAEAIRAVLADGLWTGSFVLWLGMQESASGKRAEAPDVVDRMPKGLPLQALPMYFFVHVQKTGGTSLNMALARMFGRFAIFHETVKERAGGDAQIRSFLENNTNFYDNIMLIGGHMGYRHPLIQMTGRRRVLLSAMREPIERITSLYDYIRYRTDHPAHAELNEMTLFEAIQHHRPFRSNCMNAQLRLIFGTPEADIARRLVRRRNYVIGRFDHLERFLGAVEVVSGLKRKEPLSHRNARPEGVIAKPAVEQADYANAVELLSAMNAGDIGFYKTMPPVLVTIASA